MGGVPKFGVPYRGPYAKGILLFGDLRWGVFGDLRWGVPLLSPTPESLAGFGTQVWAPTLNSKP